MFNKEVYSYAYFGRTMMDALVAVLFRHGKLSPTDTSSTLQSETCTELLTDGVRNSTFIGLIAEPGGTVISTRTEVDAPA